MMRRAATAVALVCASGLAMGDVIASQNFNDLDASGTQTFDQLPAGSMLTNTSSSNAGGPGMDFATFWAVDTRGVGFGPVTPNNDSSDFIGANTFTGNNSPDVGPDGTPVSAGVEQNFEFNDGDGQLDLVFEPVSLAGCSGRTLEADLWINNTSYESDDFMFITVEGAGSQTLLAFGETDLEGNASDDDGSANWLHVSFDLEPVIAALGDNLTLTISVDNNSGSENIFADNVSFNGVVPAPASLALLGLGGLVATRRRR